MPQLTPQQVMTRHLQLLLQNERALEVELRRIERGLAATRRQIERERRALAGERAAGDTAAGQHAA